MRVEGEAEYRKDWPQLVLTVLHVDGLSKAHYAYFKNDMALRIQVFFAVTMAHNW